MNTFSENPLFLFVDELADGSPNFATEGKIVELFDTGCDARTPGAALKIGKESDTIIHSEGSTQNNIPNVRKPFSLSLHRNKTPVKKNTRHERQEDKIQIAGTCSKLPNQSKPAKWNSKLKDNVATTESTVSEVKSGRDSVVRNRSNVKVSEYSKRVGVSPVEHKTKPNSTRICTYSNYGENNRTVKSQLISSSVPKSYKVPDPRSTIYSTHDGRAKTNPTKPVTNSRMTLPVKMSKVTSEASLNQGVKKSVNRAVDKDSLSNCSRQLEMAKTSGAPFFSKTGYASRLPRSTAAAKSLPKGEIHLEAPTLIGKGKEATMKPESKTALMKIVGGTDYELQDKSLRNKTTKKIPTVNSWKRRDRPEGETTSKVNLAASPMLSSQRNHGDDVKAKLSTKARDVENRETVTRSSSKSKIAVRNVPLSRFGRNLLIGEKSVQKPRNSDEVDKVDQVSIARVLKSNGNMSSKIENADKAPCRDSDNKLSASGRLATNPDKVRARPSAKCHNLTTRESDAKNSTISSRTEFSKSKTSSIVPKLMAEFGLQENNDGEVSGCSQRSPAVPPVTKEVKMPNEKLKTDSNGKPPRTSGTLSNELNERLSRFSDRVQEVLLSGVTECTGIGHRSVDRNPQGNLKVDVESVPLSGAKLVEENDEEIELKTIFEDTSVTAGRQPETKLSRSHSGTRKARESKLRHLPVCPSGIGSKVPRPLITKRIPRKEMPRNLSTRTCPKKQESLATRGAPKKSAKTNPVSETKPSTPPVKKSVDHIPESENPPKTLVVTEEDNAEDVIPIMNPALYNVHSFATHYRNRGNLENTVPQVTGHGGKLESWIDGHEQAYLKGRAIGLKVASMARAAKENLKREFVRSGLRSTTPKSLPDKSQEIVDIGVSVIEKVLAEKANKIHSPSVRGDQVPNYGEFDENTKWHNSRQWFM